MIYQQFTSNQARILIWEISESIDELCDELMNFEVYSLEYLQLRTDKRRREFLCVRIAINNLVGSVTRVFYDEVGRPYLIDNSLEISISHTADWIAVICHPSSKVGIDIEKINPKIQKIYKRFLSEKEQSNLMGEEDLKQLTLAWSAKEALFKIIGNEAVDFAKHLCISAFQPKESGLLNAVHLPSNKKFDLDYICYSNFVLVYCVDNK